MKNTPKIIGLTGNIATGKSIVRRMLENSGALGIDADAIAHRMLYPEGAAYQNVINAFGEEILTEDRLISHKKLGEIVFNHSERLAELESMVHPEVKKAILKRVKQSQSPIVVIEAIKLLESGLGKLCSAIWVSHASSHHQLMRLMQTRNMQKDEAQRRISSQPPQTAKIAQADEVIHTEGSFKSTWDQTVQALNDIIYPDIDFKELHINISINWKGLPISHVTAAAISAFWQTHANQHDDLFYQLLGLKMILPIIKNEHLLALIQWDNRNFTATLNRTIPIEVMHKTMSQVIELFEEHARSKQCEVLFLPNIFNEEDKNRLGEFGFIHQPVEKLPYQAWRQEGLRFKTSDDKQTYMKVLSQPTETTIKHFTH